MASSTQAGGLFIQTLRGGQNDSDPTNAIADDEVVIAQNVEFWDSTLGERRLGTESVSITGSSLDDEDGIVHLGIHYAELTEVIDAELWAVAATEDTSFTISRRAAGAWTDISPIDDIDVGFPEILKIQTQSLHGKLHFCAKPADEDINRHHVWDGTSLRRSGLAAPAAAPVVTDTAGVGTYAGERIFRVRYIVKSGTEILLKSEPSEETIFVPTGTNTGATITKPAATGEGETHWEVEASDGDGNFYIIAEIVVGTTTYNDTTILTTDYAVNGELSADIGDYALIPAVKFVVADQDRPIFAGDWFDPEKDSRVSWTPPHAATGVGNDERIPIDTDNFLDLDWQAGGGITGLSHPVNGAFYAFKWQRIYKLQRTGRIEQAYQAFLLSTSHGAIYGSVTSGLDEYGRGCIYFDDPCSGPMRIGAQGIQYMEGIRGTWSRVNTSAENIVSHGCFYPDKRQLHKWVAVDGGNTPGLGLISQTNELRADEDGVSRGWSVVKGLRGEAWCSLPFPEVITDEETGSTTLSWRPLIGLPSPHFIQKVDIGSTDNGVAYRAKIRTKPYIVAGLLNKWGAMTAALLAEPLESEDVGLEVRFIRDFGLESNYITTDFVGEANETSVIKVFDNLRMSNAVAIQMEFADPYVGID